VVDARAVAPPLQSASVMTNTILTLDQLATVTGGGNAPLGGNVRQNVNTNWGGTQTNINTQVINPPAHLPATTITEYLRTNPAARLEALRHNPVGRY
jgi:hypothetical protein